MLKAELLSHRKSGLAEYAMYEARVGKCRGYILYAENEKSAAMELICTDGERAHELFAALWRCELSPAHLCDVAADLRACESLL